ncbi:MAG: hypothetical protein Q7R45_02330, partial [Sulfuricaulis sp.]|nr:hypothetical protein [Sulfuricaulis sp.]
MKINMPTADFIRHLYRIATVSLGLVAGTASVMLQAQDTAGGVSLRVQASTGGFYAAPQTFQFTATGYFLPTPSQPSGILNISLPGTGTATASQSTTIRLEQGKVYSMSVSGYNLSFFDLKFDAPAGYQVEIDGDLTSK